MPKKRKDGLYQKRVPDKYVENGAPRIIYGKTNSEIAEKLGEIKIKYNKETVLFSTVADEWQDSHFKTIRYNTTTCYLPSLKQLKEYFKSILISDITPNKVQTFINQIAAKNYARQTVKIRLIVIHQIFNYALTCGYVNEDITQSIKIPKNLSVKKNENVGNEVIEKIHDNTDTTFGILAYLLLYTGCRLCEALALQWNDIDFENNMINVDKIIEWQSNQPVLRKNTKTKSGNRKIILLNNLKDVLLKIYNKEGYIINIENKPISKTQYRKNWAKLGLEVKAHQLRHEYATMLYNSGVDAKTAQSLLGHSSIAVTMDIYTHLENKKKQEAANKINDYLNKIVYK